MSVLAEIPNRAEAHFHEVWRNCRDNGQTIRIAQTQVAFALEVGILTQSQAELWALRLQMCPGHEDEGGRRWCSYCGTLPKDL